jgi:hypothetical protein
MEATALEVILSMAHGYEEEDADVFLWMLKQLFLVRQAHKNDQERN